MLDRIRSPLHGHSHTAPTLEYGDRRSADPPPARSLGLHERHEHNGRVHTHEAEDEPHLLLHSDSISELYLAGDIVELIPLPPGHLRTPLVLEMADGWARPLDPPPPRI